MGTDRLDCNRVRPPRVPRAPTEPRLHTDAASKGGSGLYDARVDTEYRQSHHEPAAEDRAGPSSSEDHQDGLRSGIQACSHGR